MFEDAYYRWDRDPADGEYELQFDRFESSKGGVHHDQVVLIIVDKESEKDIGDVILPTTEVPGIEHKEAVGTRIFHGTIEDREIIDLTYDQELSEQRHKEAQERLDRMHGDTDEE